MWFMSAACWKRRHRNSLLGKLGRFRRCRRRLSFFFLFFTAVPHGSASLHLNPRTLKNRFPEPTARLPSDSTTRLFTYTTTGPAARGATVTFFRIMGGDAREGRSVTKFLWIFVLLSIGLFAAMLLFTTYPSVSPHVASICGAGSLAGKPAFKPAFFRGEDKPARLPAPQIFANRASYNK